MTREATYVLIGICVHLPLAAFLCSVPLGGGSRGGVFCVRGGPAQDCPGIPWHCVLCIQTSSPASALGAWNSGSGRGASRHSFSHSPSLDFGSTLSHCRFSGSAAVCRAKASIQPKGHSWGVCYRRVLHRQVNVTDFQITLKP